MRSAAEVTPMFTPGSAKVAASEATAKAVVSSILGRHSL
jgi:hypothetical protein